MPLRPPFIVKPPNIAQALCSEKPDGPNTRCVNTTPGDNCISINTVRPGTGSSSIFVGSSTRPRDAVAVWIISWSPTTVIASVFWPTSMTTGRFSFSAT